MNDTLFSPLRNETKLAHLINLSFFFSEKAEDVKNIDFTNFDWKFFLDYVTRNKIYALIYKQIKKLKIQIDFPPDIEKELKNSYIALIANNIKKYEEAKTLSATFNAEKIKHIYMKGMVMADLMYKDIGIRSMSDMDILIPEIQISKAEKLIQSIGYQCFKPERSDSLHEMRYGHQLPMYVKDGVGLELHYCLIDKSQPYQLDINSLIDRAVLFEAPNLSGYMFCPEDFLLHIIQHFYIEFEMGWGSISQANDIHLCLRQFESILNWEYLNDQVYKFNLKEQMDLSFTLVNVYYELNFPQFGFDSIHKLSNLTHKRYILRMFDKVQYSEQVAWGIIVKMKGITGFRNKLWFLFKNVFPDKAFLQSQLKTKSKRYIYLYPAFYVLMTDRFFSKIKKAKKFKLEFKKD